MNLRTFLIAGVSALFGLCLALVVINSVSAQLVETPELVVEARERTTVERFKLITATTPGVSATPGVLMYDTTTADCWFLITGTEEDPVNWKWVSLGNPKNAAAEKK